MEYDSVTDFKRFLLLLNMNDIKLQILVLSFWTVHCLGFPKRTKFRKLNLFPSSRERRWNMCLVESDRPRTRHPVSETLCSVHSAKTIEKCRYPVLLIDWSDSGQLLMACCSEHGNKVAGCLKLGRSVTGCMAISVRRKTLKHEINYPN
jgi:hypothetical protein